MFFYFVLLLFLLIPIGFGFGLAVYLKRKYDNPPPRPERNEASPVAENILDILKESSVAQDILLAKNKIPEEDIPEELPQNDSGFIPEQPGIEPRIEQQSETAPPERVTESQDELLARVLESFHEFSPEKPGEEVVEKPVEEVPKETPPKITKSTFENIPVYGSVPEELLETHLCLDQELPPEVHDSFAAVPDGLFNRFEVDSPPGSEQFVQTRDTAIAIRKKEERE